jgi:RNA polymerase sigma factor (sigma-70 family)
MAAPIALAPNPVLQTDLQRALQRLPEAYREAFLLREVAGLSYTEICEVTEASEAAVRSRIFRARRQLRVTLHSERSAASPALSTQENQNE